MENPDEQPLVKNRSLGVIPQLGKEWRVSFEFRPTNYDLTAVRNLIQLTTGVTSSEHGSSTPEISFQRLKDQKVDMVVRTSLNRNPSYYVNLESLPTPEIDEWTKIEVDQRQEGCSYFFTVSIANKEVVQRQNLNPRKFSNVTVFASNTEDEAQLGSIRNLTIVTSTGEFLISKQN